MPGHAMVGMWIDANHSYILPLETTLVGGSATAVEAITAGESLLGQQPWLIIVDVAEARDAGLLPMP